MELDKRFYWYLRFPLEEGFRVMVKTPDFLRKKRFSSEDFPLGHFSNRAIFTE